MQTELKKLDIVRRLRDNKCGQVEFVREKLAAVQWSDGTASAEFLTDLQKLEIRHVLELLELSLEGE